MIPLESIKPGTPIFFQLNEDVTEFGERMYLKGVQYWGVIVEVEPEQNRFWILCNERQRMTHHPIDLNKELCSVRIAMGTDTVRRLPYHEKLMALASEQITRFTAELERWKVAAKVLKEMRD